MPATGSSQKLALFLTGDGGWAGLDKGVAGRFAERGIATIGFDSRRYFWHKKSPEQSARDVERVLRHYLATWKKTEVMLVGYSFGADVLPFIANRLPLDLRSRLTTITLLGPEPGTSFEVHLMDWLPGVGSGGLPVQPEIQALGNLPVLCVYGEGESDALCPPATREPRNGRAHRQWTPLRQGLHCARRSHPRVRARQTLNEGRAVTANPSCWMDSR